MPLYEYECQECGHIFELFLHSSDQEVELECPKCAHKECKRLVPFTRNRVLYKAKENYSRRLGPEVDRIMDKVNKGSDKDFLDICGDK